VNLPISEDKEQSKRSRDDDKKYLTLDLGILNENDAN
jgi:hypothetical protein